jgi:hypothetical protein
MARCILFVAVVGSTPSGIFDYARGLVRSQVATRHSFWCFGVGPMATVASVPPEIEYPSSDGEPMAETPIHRDVMSDLIAMLGAYFADEPEAYVSGAMMMYYVEGNMASTS